MNYKFQNVLMIRFLIVLLFVFMLFGCNKKVYKLGFNYSYNEISEIKIIEYTGYNVYNDICDVDLSLKENVYNDVTNLKFNKYIGSLSSPRGKCIKIVFENGEYDIISRKEPKHCKYDGEEIVAYNSWLVCDRNEFNALIDKYMSN